MSYLTSTYTNQRHTIQLLRYSFAERKLAHQLICPSHRFIPGVKKNPTKAETDQNTTPHQLHRAIIQLNGCARQPTVPAYLETSPTLWFDIIRLC
ncbi:unnamed protein product [Tuber melanosporum]|uniref:(Perigord truffle) hypothetical protein n=1 Tax=Tuber melanosporum (strain Mel28) TaxID=656061 RepID=D5GIB7_TUBMM|nr:uncharacterized protein GSTUM_00008402001 [Tuber melanosporum]CAZ84260.1 unnamed protein product [Tuber melanosporum]